MAASEAANGKSRMVALAKPNEKAMRNLGLQEKQQTVKQQFQERTMTSIQFVVFGVMIGTLALLAGCPQPPSLKCNPNQIDIVPKIAGSLTDLTWKVTTTCAGPLNGIVCFEGGNESLCAANILDTPTINSKSVTNLTSSRAVDFLLPFGAERVSFLYCDSSTLSLTTPHTCSDGSAPRTKTVDRQEPPCPSGEKACHDFCIPESATCCGDGSWCTSSVPICCGEFCCCPAAAPLLCPNDDVCRASLSNCPPGAGGDTITCENSIRIEIGPADSCQCDDLTPIIDPNTGELLFEPTLSCAVGTPDELITIIPK